MFLCAAPAFAGPTAGILANSATRVSLLSGMENHPRDHLRRLDKSFYRGLATVHWVHSLDQRRSGWLDGDFHAYFRESLTHAGFLFGVWCPGYCLMPDHVHLVWSGTSEKSDHLLATRWLRRRMNLALDLRGFRLQKQAYDRVLRPDERERFAFERMLGYVLANPQRSGLESGDPLQPRWQWRGAILPGYPELSWSGMSEAFSWDLYWKLFYQAIEEPR
jgi:putative transposase